MTTTLRSLLNEMKRLPRQLFIRLISGTGWVTSDGEQIDTNNGHLWKNSPLTFTVGRCAELDETYNFKLDDDYCSSREGVICERNPL